MSNVIAIDGPSGAGKSSCSRLVGERLGYLHVDSGALYRIMTWQALENAIDTSDPEAVAAFAGTVEIACRPEGGHIAFTVKGEAPGERIRSPEINAHASSVAKVKAVRDRITALLRGLTRFGDLIIEGRDITTAVFPDTPARFYLTASAEARARRRQKEEIEKGIANQSAEDVKASLLARDAVDSTRKYAPLRKADGAVEIDSSDLTLEQVVEHVIAALPEAWRAARAGGGGTPPLPMRAVVALCLLAGSVFGAMPTGGLCAHRGDQADYPENTVPAFRAAVAKGAAMVEFDVHRCKTGELIVMHDGTIDRTTTGKGRWSELTFDYLRSVDAGVKKGPQFKGVKIPTFDEAIDCFPMDGVWLNVHCDDSVTDEVARKIKAKGRLHQAFIAAEIAGVRRARAAVPEIKVCLFALPKDSWHHTWTAEERRASVAAVMAAKAEFTQPHFAPYTLGELAAFHARGGKMNYFWCNEPEKVEALVAGGIDFPLTDCLTKMQKAVDALPLERWLRPVAAEMAHWEGCPISWAMDGRTIRPRGPGGVMFLREKPITARTMVEAEVTPGATVASNDWPVAGIAIGESERNYWHLAFVQAPTGAGGQRIMEVCEMREGEWLAQTADKLPRLPGAVLNFNWKKGETYRLRLTSTEKSVCGEVRDARGKVVYRLGYDLSGKHPAVRGGRPALHASGVFPCAFGAVRTAQQGAMRPEPKAEALAFPSYASDSYVKGVTDRATGFFRVKQMADGKWWVIDPLGRGTVIFGVDHVRWGGHITLRTKPPRQHYLEHNRAAYPDRTAWEEETLARLKRWGFNMLGAGSDESLKWRGLTHTLFLSMGDHISQERMPREFYICPNEHRPCSAMPNVFHPDFPAWCDWVAKRRCAPNRNDPWLFGYFIDNELAWWGRGHRQTGLWETVLALPADHSARKALLAYAAERKIADPAKATSAEKTGFVRLAAERYFASATAAIRRHDPNHLVLGARFAGVGGAPDVVWEEAGKYCDLVTFNSYPFVDLDRGTVHNSQQDRAKSIVETYAERQALVKRPMLLTEWSFPALDSGLPCTGGAGQRFYTQRERAEATRLYAQTLLSLPYMIGYDYFMWVDEPPEGISDAFPEDSNYGLVSEKGVPYKELCAVFTDLQTNIGAARSRPLPAPKAAKGGGGAASGWEGRALTHWKVNGKDVGDYTVMLSFDCAGTRHWHDCSRVKSCVKQRLPDGELWTLVGEGGAAGGIRFEMTHTLRFFTGRNYFLANVVAVRNTGKVPLEGVSVFFRTYAPYALEPSDDYADGQNVWSRRKKGVPNLWKGPKKGCWMARDGRYIGVVSMTGAMGYVNYMILGGSGQHPDAQLFPTDEPLSLSPGETHVSDGRLWFYVVGGTDGAAGWMKATADLEKGSWQR